MTQPGSPDPVELFQAAAASIRPILAGVGPEQLDLATPCTDWNVRQLLHHIIRGVIGAHDIITGGPGIDPMDVSGPLPPEGADEAFADASARLAEALKVPGVLEKTLDLGPTQVTVAKFALFMLAEAVIHGWDLARATGQDASIDDSLAGAALQILGPEMEIGREMGLFALPVAVPPDAGSRDRLLGLTGRTP